MGWLKDAVKATAEVVEEAVNAVVEAVSDVVETVANAIEDGADAIADQAEKIPTAGNTVARVVRQVGGLVAAPFRLVAVVVKGAGAIVSGLVTGIIRVVGGSIALDAALIKEGLGDIGSGIAGAILMVGAELISVVQAALFLYVRRRLTQAERDLLKRVFCDSLALYNIRIVDGSAGVFSGNSRPFVAGNTVYMKNVQFGTEQSQFVHECVHVWQYQHYGARYSSDALFAQRTLPNAYHWEDDIQRGRTDWVDFNMEAQAQLMKHIYDFGELSVSGNITGPGSGVFFDADGTTSVGIFNRSGDNTARANDGVAAMRGATSYRLSRKLIY